MSRTMEPASLTEFEKLKEIVCENFQVEEALIEHNIPTFYLKQPQETKQAFLKLLKKLELMNFVAFLRRADGKLVLKIVRKQPVKPSRVLVNWLLFIATIGTTFTTGYILASNLASIGGEIDPIFGGVTFTIAIMAILVVHEMGHKLTANKNRIEATPPYFIPGPPPIIGGGIGTFGAVIVQKSLPPNKDALFDIGMSGPISGFIIATIVTAVGLAMSVPAPPTEEATILPVPLIMIIIGELLRIGGLVPVRPQGKVLYLHPVGFAVGSALFLQCLTFCPQQCLMEDTSPDL